MDRCALAMFAWNYAYINHDVPEAPFGIGYSQRMDQLAIGVRVLHEYFIWMQKLSLCILLKSCSRFSGSPWYCLQKGRFLAPCRSFYTPLHGVNSIDTWSQLHANFAICAPVERNTVNRTHLASGQVCFSMFHPQI